jgi:putative transcriptional regulator
MADSTPNIHAIRVKTKRTQQQFADDLGLPAGTLRAWEQNRRNPCGPALTLLRLLARKPELIDALK